MAKGKRAGTWLNSTVIGAGITSFLGDLSYETVAALLPSFMIFIGAPVYALGLIEGFSDGLSSFTKLFSGYYTDVLGKRREFAVLGYIMSGIYPFFVALASSWLFVLIGKAVGWLGKGMRGPPRDAILADAVDEKDLGKAFGLHRTADTLGAVLGPLFALVLLSYLGFKDIFLAAGIIGLLAAASFWFLVKGEGPKKSTHARQGIVASMKGLPEKFKGYMAAILVFGLADFSHTLLILLAVSKLTPSIGLIAASAMGVLFYALRNVTYALASYPIGWLGDKYGRKKMLVLGYALAVVTFVGFIFTPVSIPYFAVLFAMAGVFIAAEDTLESSVAAELTDKTTRGISFGVLATANGVGDLVSSVLVGLLWAAFGFPVGLAYSAILAAAGTIMMMRIL